MLQSIIAAIVIFFASIFGGHQVQLPPSAQSQPAAAASAVLSNDNPFGSSTTSPSQGLDDPGTQATTTIVNYITDPVIERVVDNGSLTANFVTQPDLTAQLLQLSTALSQKFTASATSSVPEYVAADGNPAIPYAAENAIDNLSNVTITSPTFSGVTTSNIPEGSNLYYTDARVLTALSSNSGTTTFGSGIALKGGCVSVNGTCLTAGGGGGGPSASSTLLSDNNDFIGNNAFSASTTFSKLINISNASTSFETLGTEWFSGLANSLLATDQSGKVIASSTIGWNLLKGPASSIFSFDNNGNPIATTSIGVNYLTGVLPIAHGGVGTSTWQTNSIPYFNGTTFTGQNGNLDAFVFNGSDLGIGTASPDALVSISNNTVNGTTTILSIASSTVSATSTLLTFDNQGRLSIGPNISPVSGSAQLSVLAGATTLTEAGSTNAGLSSANSVYVQGPYAYVADGSNGLVIFDISNPASPVAIGAISTGLSDPVSVYVQGHYAYVADASDPALVIFDVSDPTSPIKVGSISTGLTSPRSVYVQGRFAYVADFGGRLIMYDISNPASPTEFNSSSAPLSNFSSVYVQGRYAYVTDENDGLLVILDNSTSNMPEQSAAGAGTPTSVYVQGPYAYVTDDTGNLFIFDISDPSSASQLDAISTGLSDPVSVYVQGRYAYVADNINGLVVFDISNPFSPVEVSSISTAGPASVYVQGRYAYVAGGNNLDIIDLGGGYVQQLQAGGIEAGTLNLQNNLAAVDAAFSGGVTVGQSLNVNGSASILGATTLGNSLIVGGNVTLSVGTPSALLALSNTRVLVATTSIGVNYLTGVLPIAHGGVGTSTWQTNSIPYFNGTTFTGQNGNLDAFVFNGSDLGIGTTTPYSRLEVWGPDSGASPGRSTQHGFSGINAGFA